MNTEPMPGQDVSRPARPARPFITPQLVVGVFIMLIGVLLMLDRLDVLSFAARLLRFWPVGLIALGASMVVRRADSHGRFWGFAWMFLGTWLLLNVLGVVRVGFWELFWPAVLILIGLNLIKQTARRSATAAAAGTAGEGSLFAVLSESKRIAHGGESFRGAGMTALMGGCLLDLRQATMSPGQEAIVDVFGVMAGHEIVVPAAWTVVPDIVPVLAGVEDKRLPVPVDTSAPPSVPPPRLVVRGFLLMSGLTIKS
jgi:hypothetical protein